MAGEPTLDFAGHPKKRFHSTGGARDAWEEQLWKQHLFGSLSD